MCAVYRILYAVYRVLYAVYRVFTHDVHPPVLLESPLYNKTGENSITRCCSTTFYVISISFML